MKAIVWTQYGSPDVLQLRDIAKPAPKDDELLIMIRATTATSGDCEMRALSGSPRYTLPMRAYIGPRRPLRIQILGMELAGEVEAVGSRVTRFRPGDAVFAATGFLSMGTCAEYLCLPEAPEGGALAPKPSTMSFEEAATVPVGGLEALSFLRQGQVERGQSVLINGAGGTVGTFAVQLARDIGAEVTAVDSADKLEMLRTLGADHVIDYERDDFSRGGARYDFILDVIGKRMFARCLRALKPRGRYLISNPGLLQRLRGHWTSAAGGKQVIFGVSHPTAADLDALRQRIEAGRLRTFIDRAYRLEAVAEAHRYVETGRKRGHVVITVGPLPTVHGHHRSSTATNTTTV
ncbi:MAG: NAD(P)-dependent alcohol dehydrogenase [Anaerolineae bacterium]|nr:NAD(P)-dependent alcohol dehydrogenase [Anaerolineae bacterium]